MGIFSKKKEEPDPDKAPEKKHKHNYVDGRTRRGSTRGMLKVEQCCDGCPASHWEDRAE